MGIGRTPTFSAAALPLIVRSDTMPKTVALRVLKTPNAKGAKSEVVDGQQRLTTKDKVLRFLNY